MSTFASIATDPIEAWIRFREQWGAQRKGHTPPDLYQAEGDWEQRLHRLLDLASPDELTSEFWAIWANLIPELES